MLVALFGGFRLDDELRAIRPGGRRFTGLLDASLENYRNDPRAFYLFAITEDGVDQIEETVKRIGANGNRLNFSFYSKYDSDDPLRIENGKRLLDVALRAKDLHPETVVSHPYYIETMITGRSHWSEFGYPVCPTVSVGHAAHSERLANGNPTLPGFRTWASDLETINFCCTSGHCDGCRDSQVVFSWLLVSLNKFRRSGTLLKTWIEIAESFWSQYVWSPYGGRAGFRFPVAEKPGYPRHRSATRACPMDREPTRLSSDTSVEPGGHLGGRVERRALLVGDLDAEFLLDRDD